ncbi:protein kinase [Streptomyces echinoruber]|uniref:protein kinase n=1 Tax=Streptomyces echinoruber TaxID=68898 RepID=UPI00167EDB35|nr:protein kinase [Streptomyces echinoruber]
MDDYAGRVLADRYRLPLPPSDEYELTETRAFDTYSGQEVFIRQVPLPEVVEAEVLDADGLPEGFTARDGAAHRSGTGAAARRPADPVVRRAVEAARAAAAIPDHPRLDQVFDVFAEGGSLWIVSELVAARPLAALLAEKPLPPYRAAEVASDLLMALRAVHAHGWVHRNITARTVLVCDDGRVVLTGLAAGAAEEALCGYDPVPRQRDAERDGAQDADSGEFGAPAAGDRGPVDARPHGGAGGDRPGAQGRAPAGPQGPASSGPHGTGPFGSHGPTLSGSHVGGADPETARRAAIQARARGLAAPGPAVPPQAGPRGALAQRATQDGTDIRAARAGAIAAYRAGARAAARVQQAQDALHHGGTALPAARPPAEPGPAAGPHRPPHASDTPPPDRIAHPYGVDAGSWHGATPRGAAGAAGPHRPALPTGGPEDTTGPADAYASADTHASADAHALHDAGASVTRWDQPPAGVPAGHGPTTALAAERARQARMAVVGPVTERWAPEQAGPVHENWQLAAPVGPATDLWALGALLFRAVQGHAPYPEESTAELVQMVCAEPPAYAEECGPLRPVVESLLRQDPTERIDFEELAGWLRSLVRSAPEPDAGVHVVPAPPADAARLPVVRRRGELVRRRRAGLPAHHGRHKRAKEGRSPRSLGRTLLLLILLALVAAVAYAMLFLPKAGGKDAGSKDRTGAAGQASAVPGSSGASAGNAPRPDRTSPGGNAPSRPAASTGAAETQTTGPGVADGFTLRKDPEGFRIAVAKGWHRSGKNDRGEVVYRHGDFELIVVPGRDGAGEYGSDPMAYQREKEPELQGYRDSTWATSSGLRTIEVGGRTMAEGQFTWTDAAGADLYVRNLALLLDGRYHVVQVRGPEAQRDEVTRLYEQAQASYRYTG